eukprot:170419-Chlamydomonas_euryale.AAC.3
MIDLPTPHTHTYKHTPPCPPSPSLTINVRWSERGLSASMLTRTLPPPTQYPHTCQASHAPARAYRYPSTNPTLPHFPASKDDTFHTTPTHPHTHPALPHPRPLPHLDQKRHTAPRAHTTPHLQHEAVALVDVELASRRAVGGVAVGRLCARVGGRVLHRGVCRPHLLARAHRCTMDAPHTHAWALPALARWPQACRSAALLSRRPPGPGSPWPWGPGPRSRVLAPWTPRGPGGAPWLVGAPASPTAGWWGPATPPRWPLPGPNKLPYLLQLTPHMNAAVAAQHLHAGSLRPTPA